MGSVCEKYIIPVVLLHCLGMPQFPELALQGHVLERPNKRAVFCTVSYMSAENYEHLFPGLCIFGGLLIYLSCDL